MVEVKVTIEPETVRYLRKLSEMPREVPKAVQRGLESALVTVTESLKTRRLSGRGPYPPSQHKLGARSGVLRDSVYYRTSVRGNTVTGTIGSDVLYAPVHEYGAVIHARNKPYLVFKIRGKTIRAKSVTIPERAPFRTEAESAQTARIIAHEVTSEVERLGSQ